MSACAGMFLPVFAWGGTDVNIDNPLAECVDIHPVHRQEMDNLTILKTTVTLKKSTGECGCFSTLINYTSLLAQDVEGYGTRKCIFPSGGEYLTGEDAGTLSFQLCIIGG